MVFPIEQHFLSLFVYYDYQYYPIMVCEHNMDKFCQPKIIEIISFISFRKSNSKKYDATYMIYNSLLNTFVLRLPKRMMNSCSHQYSKSVSSNVVQQDLLLQY